MSPEGFGHQKSTQSWAFRSPLRSEDRFFQGPQAIQLSPSLKKGISITNNLLNCCRGFNEANHLFCDTLLKII